MKNPGLAALPGVLNDLDNDVFGSYVPDIDKLRAGVFANIDFIFSSKDSTCFVPWARYMDDYEIKKMTKFRVKDKRTLTVFSK